MDNNKLEYHKLANLFPLIEGDEFKGLVEDIGQNGQLEPVWLYEGKILDGRNRYRACLELGIEPKFKQYEGDEPLSFVISLNLHRRHLTTEQKLKIGLKMLPEFEARAKERQREYHGNQYDNNESGLVVKLPQVQNEQEQPKARDEVAKIVKVSASYLQQAKKIEKEAPELIAQMDDNFTFSQAKKAATVEPELREQVINLVKSGEAKNVDEAKKKMRQQKREEEKKQQAKIQAEIAEKKANVILICGKAEDCPQIEDGSIDLIITSPPYNFGGDFWPMGGEGRKAREQGIGYDDDMPYDEYFDWQIKVCNEMYRVAKDGASFFYNHKVRQFNGGIVHPLSWLMRDDNKWTIRQEIVWDRKSTHNHTASLFWQHDERIYWMTKGKPTITNAPIGLPSIWQEFGPIPDQNNHPAPFTPKLPEMILKIFIRDGLKVLDPFVGSGTVIDVCYDAGVDSYGIDISQDYINKIKERYE